MQSVAAAALPPGLCFPFGVAAVPAAPALATALVAVELPAAGEPAGARRIGDRWASDGARGCSGGHAAARPVSMRGVSLFSSAAVACGGAWQIKSNFNGPWQVGVSHVDVKIGNKENK